MAHAATDMLNPTPPDRSTARKAAALVFFLAICIAAMVAGAVVTTPNVTTWYKELAQPPWTPPPWLFGPVWTVLYIMMAISAWLVWKRGDASSTRYPLTLFGIQLALTDPFGIANLGLGLTREANFFGCFLGNHRLGKLLFGE